jgi:DNA mismatch repair protein MutL
MTKRITVLKPDVYRMIAAGEVIERPLSVVKELVENSIDAGADDIAVRLVSGGTTRISVEDNGTGFNPSDVEVAFQRHTTSKLVELDDLDRIRTLGFRGEALPSILEVARVELKSADNREGRGLAVVFENNRITSRQEIAFKRGTLIDVRDLFYNFPVRKKFLKSDRTELNKIVAFLEQCSLANFDISLSLENNGRSIFAYDKTDNLKDRVYQVFGRDFLDRLQDISLDQPPYGLNGFASRLNTGAGDKKHQFLFVNRRPIRERTLIASLNRSYQNYLEKSRSPAAILMFEVPPAEIDVNIHPMKLEIKFRDSGFMYRFLKQAIDLSMTGGNSSAGKMSATGFSREIPDPRPVSGPGFQPGFRSLDPPVRDTGAGLFGDLASADDDFSLIGQYRDSYILVEKQGELLIIDQHNAHERIRYDRLKQQYQNRKVVSISPLFPLVLELTASEQLLLRGEKSDLLREMGFEIRPLSGNSFDVKRFPRILEERDVREVIVRILHLKKEEDAGLEGRVLSEIACKGSIKVNHKLHPREMVELVRDLFDTSNPHFCPHKRPIIVGFSLDEIEKKMKRK